VHEGCESLQRRVVLPGGRAVEGFASRRGRGLARNRRGPASTRCALVATSASLAVAAGLPCLPLGAGIRSGAGSRGCVCSIPAAATAAVGRVLPRCRRQ
jgi:hypothetical protein